MRLIKIRFLFKNLNWKLLLWNCVARLSLCKFNQCFKWLQFLQTEIQNGSNGHRRWSWHMLTPIDSDACCSLTTNHSHLSLDFDATAAETGTKFVSETGEKTQKRHVWIREGCVRPGMPLLYGIPSERIFFLIIENASAQTESQTGQIFFKIAFRPFTSFLGFKELAKNIKNICKIFFEQ